MVLGRTKFLQSQRSDVLNRHYSIHSQYPGDYDASTWQPWSYGWRGGSIFIRWEKPVHISGHSTTRGNAALKLYLFDRQAMPGSLPAFDLLPQA